VCSSDLHPRPPNIRGVNALTPETWLPGSLRTLCFVLLGCQLIAACGNPVNRGAKPARAEPGAESTSTQLESVQPPFAVQGELDGLLMVWFDAQGVHTAQKRSEIPEPQRAQVRIDSLRTAPDTRLDADHIYVADLRTPDRTGHYPVSKAARSWFDAQVDHAKPRPTVDAAGVVIYKASWCGACKAAASYLRSRHVDFVEKDVEKDSGASSEMLQKAQSKGLSPRGVPVIDFRGEILLGFDQARLESLIDHYAKAI
jgi:glutaredoxin